jgi:hypothetical protein
MAGMTMANVVPESRAGGELQAAIVPGFHLSDAATEDPSGTNLPQLSLFFDPGELLGAADGLGVGFRWVGGEQGIPEPMLRYRFFLDDDRLASLGIVAYGSYGSGESEGASYSAVRTGLEVATDVRLTPRYRWIELHAVGGVSLTGIVADGSYCSDPGTGYGQDCRGESPAPPTNNASIKGAYPAAFAGLSVDLFRDVPVVHSLRIGGYLAGGLMPNLHFGVQESGSAWLSWGVNVELTLGSW